MIEVRESVREPREQEGGHQERAGGVGSAELSTCGTGDGVRRLSGKVGEWICVPSSVVVRTE